MGEWCLDPSVKLEKSEDEGERVDQCMYQSDVGSLLCLSAGTRPDITFAVSNVATFCSDPTNDIGLRLGRL